MTLTNKVFGPADVMSPVPYLQDNPAKSPWARSHRHHTSAPCNVQRPLGGGIEHAICSAGSWWHSTARHTTCHHPNTQQHFTGNETVSELVHHVLPALCLMLLSNALKNLVLRCVRCDGMHCPCGSDICFSSLGRHGLTRLSTVVWSASRMLLAAVLFTLLIVVVVVCHDCQW